MGWPKQEGGKCLIMFLALMEWLMDIANWMWALKSAKNDINLLRLNNASASCLYLFYPCEDKSFT